MESIFNPKSKGFSVAKGSDISPSDLISSGIFMKDSKFPKLYSDLFHTKLRFPGIEEDFLIDIDLPDLLSLKDEATQQLRPVETIAQRRSERIQESSVRQTGCSTQKAFTTTARSVLPRAHVRRGDI